jgi:hypothetical protein
MLYKQGTDEKETLFGKSLTPAERLRQHQRSLQKAQRELEREKGKLEAQEKKTMADIKKNAKAGNMVRETQAGGRLVWGMLLHPEPGPPSHVEPALR